MCVCECEYSAKQLASARVYVSHLRCTWEVEAAQHVCFEHVERAHILHAAHARVVRAQETVVVAYLGAQ